MFRQITYSGIMDQVENPYLDWIKRTGRRTIARTFEIDMVRFMIVGAGGFTVNFIVLLLLHGVFKLPVLLGQLVAAETAILSNYYFHSIWTYRNAKARSTVARLAQFHLTAWAGSGITTVVLVVAVHILHTNYLLALVYGSAIGLVWNYLWTKYLIFAKASA